MLICLAGLPGSGRNRLCEAVSQTLNMPYMSFRDAKNESSTRALHKAVRPHLGAPYSDDLLMLVYQKIVAQFPVLSKTRPDLIVKDHFTREKPREYFFAEAEKYFGPPFIIWVDATLDACEARLREIDEGKEAWKLARHLKLLQGIDAAREPFSRDVFTVSYIHDPEKAVQDTISYIESQK